MLYQRKRKTDWGVDLSPLIDVVFLLLIFFMVSTRFKDDHGLNLDLPQSESRQNSETEHLILYVDQNANIRFEDETLNRENLTEILQKKLENFDNKMVVLHVDKNVNHGLVVEVMDAAKSAGASGLTFAAKAKSSP